MNQKERKQSQEGPSHDTEHFGGYIFTRGAEHDIYKPISCRKDQDRRSEYQITSLMPVSVGIQKTWFDVALNITGWIISLATLLVIGFYTYYAARQWHEMKRAADASATAANTAACALDESRRQFKDTLDQIKAQTTAQQGAANAAKSAADTAAGQLELSERPWLRIKDVGTRGDNPVIPALSFQKIGPFPSMPDINSQVTLQLDVAVENIGKSVAYVDIVSRWFLPRWDSAKLENDILTERKKVCEMSTVNKPEQQTNRLLLFPGDRPLEWHGGIAAPISPKTITEIPEAQSPKGIMPVAIICANYQFQLSPKVYQTSTVYVVVHKEGGMRIFPVGIGVPGSQLRLIRDEMADRAK